MLKNETEDLLLSKTKDCETPNKQTKTTPQATLEFNLTHSRETFTFKPPFSIEGCSMVGITSLKVYKSFFFNITEENTSFELYTDLFDELSFTEIKDELEEILG